VVHLLIMVNTEMATNLFTPDWSHEHRHGTKNDAQHFKAFLKALELTEESRKDELIRIKNLRPYPVDDMSENLVVAYDTFNEITDQRESTKNYVITLPCMLQIAQIDNPPMPIGWFKNSFDGNKTPVINSKAEPTALAVDLRQQILYHIFTNRKRMERWFRNEIPFHEHLIKNEGERVVRLTESVTRVNGVVGINYPLQWSTFKMFRALSNVITDTFDTFTLDPPYMTENGTYKMSFHTKDSKWKIEPRKGDIIGIGGIIRDNPYGRESLGWYPRAMRLVCLNGMISPVSFGAVKWRHQPIAGLFDSLVQGILKPRLDAKTDEPLNEFESQLPEPLATAEYLENHQLLYDHLASVMMARMLGNASKMKTAYEKAAEFVITDYKKALEMVCNKFDLGDTIKDKLGDIAITDVTIPNPVDEEFTLYDLSNVFTTYSNASISEEQRQRYSKIGGELIMHQQVWQEAIAYV